jgi:hypothetical protein
MTTIQGFLEWFFIAQRKEVFMRNYGVNKDLRCIARQVRKLGKKSADEGTYRSWETNKRHHKISWEFNGEKFLATFGNSASDWRAVKASKNQIRKALKKIGFPYTPDFLKLAITPTPKEEELEGMVEELYRLLDAD